MREPYIDQLFRKAKKPKPIYENDLREDRYSTAKPHDNVHGIRITHIPTGIEVVSEEYTDYQMAMDRFFLQKLKIKLVDELRGKVNDRSCIYFSIMG